MSKYTTEVRYICESEAGYDESKGFDDVDDIIEAAIPNVFSFDFPIFDENYRNVICTKILRHYYTREIAHETVGLWKLKMQTRLNEIMPFYNQLYESELIKFNPLYDTDITTTHAGVKEGESLSNKTKSGNTSENGFGAENESHSANNNKVDNENRTGSDSKDSVSNGSYNTNTKSDKMHSDNKSHESNGSSSHAYDDSDVKNHVDRYSDTPQGALTGMLADNYLTNARIVSDTEAKSGKSNDTNQNSERDIASAVDNVNESGNSVNIENGKEEAKYDEKTSRTSIDNTEGERQKTNTTMQNVSNEETSEGSDKYNSTESYVLHVLGKQSGISFSKMLKEFRETFLNIDMEVIDSLSDLFMNLW